MRDQINLTGISAIGFHGVFPEERKNGQNFIVDLKLNFDLAPAGESDDLTKTIDYCSVFEICKSQMAIRSKLIEQVCLRIYNQIMASHPSILSLKVKVTKLLPPMNGNVKKVSVEIKT